MGYWEREKGRTHRHEWVSEASWFCGAPALRSRFTSREFDVSSHRAALLFHTSAPRLRPLAAPSTARRRSLVGIVSCILYPAATAHGGSSTGAFSAGRWPRC